MEAGSGRPAAGTATLQLIQIGLTVGAVAGAALVAPFSSAGTSLAALVAAAACARAARVALGAARRGWALFALAGVLWAADPLEPGLRAGAVVLAATAVMVLLGRTLTGAARARTLLDATLVAVALLSLTWTSALAPIVHDVEQGSARALALAYPVGDVVILTLLVVGAARVRRTARATWTVLGGGLVLLAIGDSLFAYLHITDVLATLHGPSVDDVATSAGLLLVGLAATRWDPSEETPETGPRPLRAVAILLPYVPVAIACAHAGFRQIEGTLDTTSVGIVAALIGVLIVRQGASQFENLALARELDARIQHRTDELRRQERRFRALVQNTSDVLTLVDADGIVRYQSAAAEAVLGSSPDDLVGSAFHLLVHPADVAAFRAAVEGAEPAPARPTVVEARLRAGTGWLVTETTISNLLDDPDVQGILLTSRDVTDRKRLEERLRHDALHDPLTGLANRVLFQERLVHLLARSERRHVPFAVLMVDLDGFKAVNDTLGHAAGDRLLVEVAHRLRSSVRPGDTVARVGGDEFAVLVELTDVAIPELVAERVLERLRAPLDLDGRVLVPTASVGVASATSGRMGAEELLQAADLAMYNAKTAGKGRYEIFEESMHQLALRRVELEADLRRALDTGELVLHYQPVVEMPTGRVAGVEVLVRWQHPVRGLVPPSDFIPIAEESDLIVDIGRWVIGQACSVAADLQTRFPADPTFTVAVNVAARQLAHPLIVHHVAEALDRTGADPGSILLEITEGALMGDAREMEQVLHDLKALGVQLAIDDFGTGWSSLSRLREFPVDELKIDRDFIREIRSPDDEAPLVAGIVAMAHSLGLRVVAEGVETLDQLAALHALGCEEVQGYLLSRPVPLEKLEELLENPIGLLDGPSAAASEMRRSIEETELMMVIASATTTPTPDAALARTMLAELQRVSGLDSVVLTRIHWERAAQEVVASANGPDLVVPQGMVMPWHGSPCERMLEGGPRVTRDLRSDLPGYALARIGAVGHLTVPLIDGAGHVFGTLCGVTLHPLAVSHSTIVLFELFATLLSQHLGTVPAPRTPVAAG